MPSDAHARRIASEIRVFAEQGRLHGSNTAADWRNNHILAPRMAAVFGVSRVHDIYASVIHEALVRTGPAPVYSIGCGSGHEEIEVLRAADRLGLPPFTIIGLELSPISVERARENAAEAGLAERFLPRVHDLNQGMPDLPPAAAIMAHHVLHHIVALEQLYAQLAAALHPQGCFVTFDMMGRNGHMRWPEVLPALRALWHRLPEQYRQDHVWHQPMPHFQDWDCAIEGFEGVRAQEVLPLLAEQFVPSRLLAWGGVLETFTSDRAGPGFHPESSPQDKAFLQAVSDWQDGLLARRATTPTEFCGEFRPRASGFTPSAAAQEALRLALRRPGEVFPVVPVPDFPMPWPAPAAPQPAPLPLGEITPAMLVQAGCLADGWLPEEDGALWAIVEEQGLDLRFAAPVAKLRFELWHNLPPERAQSVSLLLDGREVARSGPMPSGELSFLDATHPDGASAVWQVRLRCATWRRPDQDGGDDRRPVSFSLFRLHAESLPEREAVAAPPRVSFPRRVVRRVLAMLRGRS